MSHSTCTHRDRVDSRILVVGSQTTSLTPGLSFDHNLCFRCPNGSCEAILDIYTSRPFQRYKEHLKARCFNPCNRALSFWESQRTPSPIFGSVNGDLALPSKWGCDNPTSSLSENAMRKIYYHKTRDANAYSQAKPTPLRNSRPMLTGHHSSELH